MKNILFTLVVLAAVASANAVEYNPAIAGEKVDITGGKSPEWPSTRDC